MASNGNRFSQTEGGAMLTPNTKAQPSFDNQDLHRREMQMPINQSSESSDTDSSDPSENDTDQEREKEELENIGISSETASNMVKEAEEKGTVDKIKGMVTKKKISIVSSILTALSPIFTFLTHALLIGIAFFLIVAVVAGKFSFMVKLLTFDSTAVAEYLDNLSGDIISGKFFYQIYMSISLPNFGYVDMQTNGLSGEAEENKRNIEIERISEVISAIMAPANYYDSTKTDETKLSDITKSSSLTDVTNFFKQGEVYRIVAEHSCMLAYAGLKDPNGKSYFETKLGNNINSASDYENAWNKVKNDECSNTSGFGNKFNISDIGGNLLSGIGTKPIEDIIKGIYEDLYGNIVTGADNRINKSLSGHIGNYEFDEKTYEKFIETYYGSILLNQLGNNKLPEDEQIKISDFASGTISMQHSFKGSIESNLKDHYENISGSGAEASLVDTLDSMYGDSKCAILEEYNPLVHEYVVSKGLESDEIYSVSDGEVVSILYSGDNIYHNYDSKSGKCLCDGIECKNSNGSELKIKFTYDEVEYMAIYSNLAEIRVDIGDQVKKGDVIATEGNSGCTNTKKLTFKIISEDGISHNPNEIVQRCSSFTNTASLCNFQNIKINLHNCDNELIKTMSFYDYVKEETYKNFKSGIDNKEFLKASALMTSTKILSDNNYKVGTTEIDIKACNYEEMNISETEYEKLDKAVSSIIGQVITYTNDFANIKYSNMCNRTEKDKNANAVYNELCIDEAIKLSNTKSYKEILKIYYPNFNISENYCNNYASKINAYAINNNKLYLNSRSYSNEEISKMNINLKNRIEAVKYGTRAAVIESARFLALGLKYKIPYKNGGKYFEEGINQEWYKDGLDSSGFVSWALKNGGANIDKTMTSKELVNNKVVGSLKITADLYKYYDKIQIGDFAYNDSKIGIIIGKNDGILYVAEANSDMGLIVTKITSYGETDSKYTRIYYADDYYNGVGNVTSMW